MPAPPQFAIHDKNAPFSVLVKPAGPDCNLRCRYCFYIGRAGMFPESARHRMDDATLAKLVRGYMALPFETHSFAWQGGEPTLAGVDFFRRAVALQRACARPGSRIVNVLQTNATLIDDEFASFLAEANFLVGVSIDGPPPLHDASRVDADNRPTYKRVLDGIEALRRHNVAFNAIVLVNKANVAAPEAIYRHLRDDLRIYGHQYIECADTDGNGAPLPFAIGGREWGEFLCRIFEAWSKHDARRVSVRLFDTVQSIAAGCGAPSCAAACECSGYFVVEHNGDVFPCDFHVTPSFRLGNIRDNSWEEIRSNPLRAAFAIRKGRMAAECKECKWLKFCQGDCPRNRSRWETFADSDNATDARSRLCDGWKRFYSHAAGKLVEMATVQLRGQARGTPARNDQCPCGSGLKFKHCCGR